MSRDLKMMAAKQMGKEAGKKATAGFGQLSQFVRENNWSIRGLSFIGSLAMIVISALKIVNVFEVLTDTFDYIVNVYSFLFAFVMLVVEAKDEWPFILSWRTKVFSNFGFLRTNLGRGLFEIFIGGIWITTSTLWVFWIGIGIMAIGVFYIITHIGGCCGKDKDATVQQAPSPILAPAPTTR
jgi:hypothetical protein